MSKPGETARAAALALLDAVLDQRRSLDEAMATALAPGGRMAGLSSRDRAFARLLTATVLRRLGQLDAAIGACLERPLKGQAQRLRNTLRLGAAQLLFLGTPAHAAVDGAVRQAQRYPQFRALVNAVLRRLGREGATILADQDAERLNCPSWLWQSWSAAYGEATTREIIRAISAEPPLDLSVKADRDVWAGRLDATMLPTGSIRITAGHNPKDLPGYREGAWWVQDAAAALPARLLQAGDGDRVLDLCAAPGGKTLQLAACGGAVTAIDMSPQRLDLMQKNLTRTRLKADLIVADITHWRPETPASRILLDAPCSGTGTIRRHPDIWHLKTPRDVERLTALQDAMLKSAIDMLAPGGMLVYAVCSLQPEEGPQRIAALMDHGAPVTRCPVTPGDVNGLAELIDSAGDLRTLPVHLADSGGMDGFYACRLVRNS